MMPETALIERKWTPAQMDLIRKVIAPKCSEEEVELLLYQASVYKLDPLLRQIWAIKYQQGEPARIFAGRDGFLAIAHQSGRFDGMDSGPIVDPETKELKGAFATVWRKDMEHPFTVEVKFSEYNKKQGNWSTMPETMIKKVAESQALRKAFNISGIYAPEEVEPSVVIGDRPEYPDHMPPVEKPKRYKDANKLMES